MTRIIFVVSLMLFSINAHTQENTLILEKDIYEVNESSGEKLLLQPISLKDRIQVNQPARTFIAFVGAGISAPIIENDFSDDFSVGLNVHGGAGYRLSETQTLRFGIQYNNFPGPGSSSLAITSIRGDLMFGRITGASTNIYGYGGMGVYLLDIAGFSETNFGFAGGIGLTFNISSTGSTLGYVETGLDYNVNDGSAKGFIPIKAGILIIP